MACSTTANFTYTVNGKRVSFRDTSRTTSKTGGTCSIKEVYWVFNNDDEEFISNPSYTFPSYNRTYPVKLKVTDSSGRSVTVTKTIRTGSAPSSSCPTPTASFTYSPSSPKIKDVVSFRPSAGGGSGATVKDYAWTYGDGATGKSNYHAYTRTGTFTVKLTVTNSCGKKKTVSKRITISSGTTGGTPKTFDIYITAPDGASISVARA